MLTLTLQCLTAVLALLFGGTAVAISYHTHALTPDRRAGWLLAGMGFLVIGGTSALQYTSAVFAYGAGEGTWAWDTFVRWAPAMNHSRITLGIAFASSMSWVAWHEAFPGRREWAWVIAAMAGAMLAGAMMGALEGPFRIGTHGFTASIGITMELIAFAVALLVSAMRGTLDAFLFLSLMLYAASLALNVPILSALSLVVMGGAEGPPTWLLQLPLVVFQCLMSAVALCRLTLLRKGLKVHEVFGRESGGGTHLFGAHGSAPWKKRGKEIEGRWRSIDPGESGGPAT